jgi:uncharacterized protein YkwD
MTITPLPMPRARRVRAACAAVLLIALNPSAASSRQDHESEALVERINDLRATPHRCGDEALPMAGMLTHHAALAQVPPVASGAPQGALQQALRAEGYAAARSVAFTLSGPRDAAAAMRLLTEHHCTTLSNRLYAHVGVARDGTRWRVVLAQPQLASDLGSSAAAGRRVLELVNAARAEPRACGDRRYAAVPPLAWSTRLAQAAQAHSTDMAQHDYIDHSSPDGHQVGDRVTRVGYRWRVVAENIAAGQGSAQQVVAGWLSSPGHCANIMNAGFADMGAAHAIQPGNAVAIYWTQVFGRALAPAR